MPAEDERRLHRAVLAGDESAWRTMYDASFAALDAYVVWRCAGLGDWADDVVQETWLSAVRRIRDFDPDRGRFIAARHRRQCLAEPVAAFAPPRVRRPVATP